jgi:hypothetical protein
MAPEGRPRNLEEERIGCWNPENPTSSSWPGRVAPFPCRSGAAVGHNSKERLTPERPQTIVLAAVAPLFPILSKKPILPVAKADGDIITNRKVGKNGDTVNQV